MFTGRRRLQQLTSRQRPHRKDLSLRGRASRTRGRAGQGRRLQFFSRCPLPCSRTTMWAVMSVGAHYTRDGIKAEITEIQPVCPVLGLRSLPCWSHPIFLEKLLPSLHDLAQEQQRLCSWPLAHHTCTPSTGVDSAVAAQPGANQSPSLSVKVEVYRRPGAKNIWEGLSPPPPFTCSRGL